MEKIVKISGDAELAEYLRMLDRALLGHAEPVKVKGSMRAILKKGNGDIFVHAKDNIIVASGFDFMADAIGNSAARPACMGYIAVGTGTTAAAAGQTALLAETARQAANYAHTANTQVFSFSTTFNPGVATAAITEAGVLNAAAAGTLYDRVVFAVINKGANDTLTQTFNFTMS
jgi:hypothetical protein